MKWKFSTLVINRSFIAFKAKLKGLWALARAFWKSANFEMRAICVCIGGTRLLSILILALGGSTTSSEEEEHDEHGGEEMAAELSDEAMEISGIKVETAGPSVIQKILRLRGEITVNRDRFVKIGARYPGTITRVLKDIGDKVKSNEVLASIESSSARVNFDIRSGIEGVIVEKDAVRGGYANSTESLFTIVDLRTVWVELYVSHLESDLISEGNEIHIRNVDTGDSAVTKVFYVAPQVDPDTQAVLVRGSLENASNQWRPGSFVEAEIFTHKGEAVVTVRKEAIHDLNGVTVVFVRDGDRFVAKPVKVGNMDNSLAEIREGMGASAAYASENSFIVKAELLKASAGHEH